MILCPGCFVDYLLPAIVNQTQEIIRICNECNCIVYQKDGCIKTTNLTTFMEERGLPDLWSELTLLDIGETAEEETCENTKNLFPTIRRIKQRQAASFRLPPFLFNVPVRQNRRGRSPG